MFVIGFGAYCVSDAHLAEADARIDSFQGFGFPELEALWKVRGLG